MTALRQTLNLRIHLWCDLAAPLKLGRVEPVRSLEAADAAWPRSRGTSAPGTAPKGRRARTPGNGIRQNQE